MSELEVIATLIGVLVLVGSIVVYSFYAAEK